MATIDQIVSAYERIEQARQEYRALLRQGISEKINQTELARRIGRTREKIRQDAMTDDERETWREQDRKRKARAKQAD